MPTEDSGDESMDETERSAKITDETVVPITIKDPDLTRAYFSNAQDVAVKMEKAAGGHAAG